MQVKSARLTAGTMRVKLMQRLEALEARMPKLGKPQKSWLPDWLMEAALQQGIQLPPAALATRGRETSVLHVLHQTGEGQ
jgi:hypothetical protein